MTTQPQSFNPHEHLIHLKAGQTTQEYLPVAWRLVWFRSVCPDGTIDTEELEFDTEREVEAEAFVWNAEKRRSEKVIKKARGYARYRAVVTDGKGGRATGTKSENAANFADYGEKAETGAIGRALAALGYGTQFAPELNEEHRIVDSPIDRTPAPAARDSSGRVVQMRPAGASASAGADAAITEQQLASIRKLYGYLGRTEPENTETMSYASAKELIAQLSQEYRQSRQAPSGK